MGKQKGKKGVKLVPLLVVIVIRENALPMRKPIGLMVKQVKPAAPFGRENTQPGQRENGQRVGEERR